MEYTKQQTAKLVDLSKTKKSEHAYTIRKIIQELLGRGEPITINKVSERSGISRQAIYSNPELKSLVDHYRIYSQNLIACPIELNGRRLMDIPSINELEYEVDKLLQENQKLSKEILDLEICSYELDKKIEDVGEIPESVDMFTED